jgi:hypothetical protein
MAEDKKAVVRRSDMNMEDTCDLELEEIFRELPPFNRSLDQPAVDCRR